MRYHINANATSGTVTWSTRLVGTWCVGFPVGGTGGRLRGCRSKLHNILGLPCAPSARPFTLPFPLSH